MRKIWICLLLCAVLLLGGCVSSMPVEYDGRRALPQVREGPQAPVGDSQSGRTFSAVLYVPNADGSQLSRRCGDLRRTVGIRAR